MDLCSSLERVFHLANSVFAINLMCYRWWWEFSPAYCMSEVWTISKLHLPWRQWIRFWWKVDQVVLSGNKPRCDGKPRKKQKFIHIQHSLIRACVRACMYVCFRQNRKNALSSNIRTSFQPHTIIVKMISIAKDKIEFQNHGVYRKSQLVTVTNHMLDKQGTCQHCKEKLYNFFSSTCSIDKTQDRFEGHQNDCTCGIFT